MKTFKGYVAESIERRGVLKATLEPREDHPGKRTAKLFWLVHIVGLGMPFTIERTFPTSVEAERAAQQLADNAKMFLQVERKNLRKE